MTMYAQSDDPIQKPQAVSQTEPVNHMPAVWTHAWQKLIHQQQQQITQLQAQQQSLKEQIRQLQSQLDRIKHTVRGIQTYE